MTFKLGRLSHDPVLYAKLPYAGPHLEAVLPATPAVVDWSRNVAPGDWGVCGNAPPGFPFAPDGIGDCTCAAVAHAIELWESLCPPLTMMPDNDVLALYSMVSGYKPGDPSTDNGAQCAMVLSQWLTDGIPCAGELDRLSAFATIDPKNHDHIRAAIWAFGAVYAGVRLDSTDEEAFAAGEAWGTMAGNNPSVLGGHCILLVGADNSGMTAVTWGTTQRLTWEWWDGSADEAYALLSPRWLAAGKTPAGFPLDALLAEMTRLKQ